MILFIYGGILVWRPIRMSFITSITNILFLMSRLAQYKVEANVTKNVNVSGFLTQPYQL